MGLLLVPHRYLRRLISIEVANVQDDPWDVEPLSGLSIVHPNLRKVFCSGDGILCGTRRYGMEEEGVPTVFPVGYHQRVFRRMRAGFEVLWENATVYFCCLRFGIKQHSEFLYFLSCDCLACLYLGMHDNFGMHHVRDLMSKRKPARRSQSNYSTSMI
jgi:hypothetical protein